jgi:hypothetical protein
MSSSPADLSCVLPRVLIVSRRTVRKNKFVDFVGEFPFPVAGRHHGDGEVSSLI